MTVSALDRGDLDTWLARLLLREGRLSRATLQTHLRGARARRPEGGPTLARVLVEQGLFTLAELEALLPAAAGAASAAPPRSATTATPRRLGDYELLERLGAGGMGTVYRARNTRSGAMHALKTLPATDPELVARFLREGEGQARADDHPHVVRVHTLGSAAGMCYLVMDLVEGGTLADRLRGELPAPDIAAGWLVDLADALEHAHGQGVLHRDLKPENVLFDGEVPKLVDFGLAKLVDAQSLTETGTVLGTPGYMAPEQVDATCGGMSPATDVYGLGALLYRCLTGRAPVTGGNLMATLLNVLEQPPPRPRDLRADLPPALETVCLRALAKAPDQRYPTAAAFRAALEAALRAEPSPPSPTRGWLGLALLGAAAVSMVVWVTRTGESTTSQPVAAPAPSSPLPSPLASQVDPLPRAEIMSGPPAIYLQPDPVESLRVLLSKRAAAPRARELLAQTLSTPPSAAHGAAYYQRAKRHLASKEALLATRQLILATLAGEGAAATVLGVAALEPERMRGRFGGHTGFDLQLASKTGEFAREDLAAACFVLAATFKAHLKAPTAAQILERTNEHERGIVDAFLQGYSGRLPDHAKAYRIVWTAFPQLRLPAAAPTAQPTRAALPLEAPPPAFAAAVSRMALDEVRTNFRTAQASSSESVRAASLARLRKLASGQPSRVCTLAHFLLAHLFRDRKDPAAMLSALASATLRGHREAAAVLGLLCEATPGRAIARWRGSRFPKVLPPQLRTACLVLATDGATAHTKAPKSERLQLLRQAAQGLERAPRRLSYKEAYQAVWRAFPASRPK